MTALHIATQEGKTDMVRYLLSKCAKQEIPDAGGLKLIDLSCCAQTAIAPPLGAHGDVVASPASAAEIHNLFQTAASRKQKEITVYDAELAYEAFHFTFIPSGDYLVVEGTSRGRMSGKSWAGGKTPGGRFCNVFKFRDGRISSIHIYLDPDYVSEDDVSFRWGMNRQW